MKSILTAVLLLLGAYPVAASSTWPGFRGDGTSRSTARNVPVRWSAVENVAWEAELPGYGQSSPVIWGDRVFITCIAGEMQDRLLVQCLDLGTGKAAWTREFKASQGVKTSDYVSKAAPTPVVDQDRLYVFFESGDLLALTHLGEPVWQRSLVKDYGHLKSNHGLGTSPVVVGELVLLQIQHENGAYLLAVDRKSGANRYKRDHPFGPGWATPAVVEHEGRQMLIATSSGRVDAFLASSGEPLWSVTGLKGNTVPSPSVGEGLTVIGSSDRNSTLALRLGGKGEITSSHVRWRQAEVVCSFGSPLVADGRVYFTNKTGVAYCLDLATGTQLWEKRLPASCWTSAFSAEGRVYFLDTNGNALVVKAGSTLEPLSENKLPVTGRVYGAAVVDGALLIRTGTRLTRVGKPAP